MYLIGTSGKGDFIFSAVIGRFYCSSHLQDINSIQYDPFCSFLNLFHRQKCFILLIFVSKFLKYQLYSEILQETYRTVEK
jgi:hypothetical protein